MALLLGTAGAVCAAVALPFTPLAASLGFQPLPARVLVTLGGLVVIYLALAEVAKRFFFRWHPLSRAGGGGRRRRPRG
jgi:Mg2+-importing ATPase